MEDRLRPNWFDREAGALRIVDQTLLPGEVQYRELKTCRMHLHLCLISIMLWRA